jgi:mono/diheme cytochrome c family protein
MRMMLRARFETAAANAAFKAGIVEKTLGDFIAKAKPEAVYFTLENGKRCGVFVFDMKESSVMPALFEDMFQAVGAEIELTPCMTPDELRAGLAAR